MEPAAALISGSDASRLISSAGGVRLSDALIGRIERSQRISCEPRPHAIEAMTPSDTISAVL